MKKKILFSVIKVFMPLLIGFLFSFTSYGQDVISKGHIKDAKTGEAVIGATIAVKGTTLGTISDLDGNFEIKAPVNSTLVISYIGYATQEVKASATSMNISLEDDAIMLGEVVAIGYGQVRKKDATGSLTSIKADDINRGLTLSPQDMLSGKTAGVQVTNSGGQPGGSSTIRIRGGASLSASNDPLIVLDGIPLSNQTVDGLSNTLSTINPNDIETFTVLKDASATAIYGTRASNGVIIITTKKGKEGAPLSLEYSGSMSINTVAKKIDILSADEFRSYIGEKYPGSVSLLGSADTKWQDEIFQTAIGQDHNISITGSVPNLPYRASVGYTNEDGVLKTSNMERLTGSIGLSPTFFQKHLTVNLNAKGVYTENRFAETGAIGNAISFDPTQPIYSDNYGYPIVNNYYTWMSLPEKEGDPINPNTVAIPNPLSQLYDRTDKSTVKRFTGNAQFEYKVHFFPDLKINFNLGYDYIKTDGDKYVPANSNYSWAALSREEGQYATYSRVYENKLIDLYLNYVKDIESIQSKVDVMAGYSSQYFYKKTQDYEASADQSKIYKNPPAYEGEYVTFSAFGRLNYTLMDKYMLTFTLRSDQTSRFAKGNRTATLPSLALGWRIADEPFFNQFENLSNLKLRLGWGITGQQDIGDDYYPYMARYTISQINAMYPFGGNFYQTLRPSGYNSGIQWEETTTYNIGLDYGFFNNRISGTLDLYYRDTDKLLNKDTPIPAGSNLTNTLPANIGKMKNRGMEFTIDTRPIVSKDLEWRVGFNVTYNHNEITQINISDDPNYIGVYTGDINGGVGNKVQIHSNGYPSRSFYVFEQVYDKNGKPVEGLYVDRNGDGVITDADRYQYKSPSPDVYMGLSSSLSYKNWDFSLAARSSLGNYVYNNVFSQYGYYSNMSVNGFLSNVVTDVKDSNFKDAQYRNDYYVNNASFLKLDYVTAGYTFKNLFKSKLRARLYGTVQNVFTITKYEGLDPEIEDGLDKNIYPRPRVFLVGLNLNF